MLLRAVILYCCCTAAAAAGLGFRLLPDTWYRYIPVRVSVACLLNVFPWACLSRSVRPCRLCLHFGAVCDLLHASSVQAWTLARAARHSLSFAWTGILSCNQEVFICWSGQVQRMSFGVGQSHKDELFNISNAQGKARPSVVLVLRIFAEIRFVIRQIHPFIFRRSAFVAVPHTYKEHLWRPLP